MPGPKWGKIKQKLKALLIKKACNRNTVFLCKQWYLDRLRLNLEKAEAFSNQKTRPCTVCNFQSLKTPAELNSLLWKFFCYITWLVRHDDYLRCLKFAEYCVQRTEKTLPLRKAKEAQVGQNRIEYILYFSPIIIAH